MYCRSGRVWYQVQGGGTPLVLLHGWCMSSAIWAPQIEGLGGTFRLVTLDLPGHGLSSPPSEGFSLAGCAEAIADLFTQLDLQGAVLLGWSLGAQIAVAASRLLADRLSALVLIGATPRFTRTAGYPHGLPLAEAEGMALKVKRNIQRARDGFSARMFASGELETPAQAYQVQELLAAVPLPDTSAALQALTSLIDTDIRESLSLIDIPTLIVNGDQDDICLPGASGFMADRMPKAERFVFAGCGHAPFLTRPAEFNACVKDFVENVSGNSARHP